LQRTVQETGSISQTARLRRTSRQVMRESVPGYRKRREARLYVAAGLQTRP